MTLRYNSLLGAVNEVVSARHPDLKVDVHFVDDMEGGWGCAVWPDDGSQPVIEINTEVQFYAVPEILLHEVAHIVAGLEEGHGPAWEAEYRSLMLAMADHLGQPLEAENLAEMDRLIAMARESDLAAPQPKEAA